MLTLLLSLFLVGTTLASELDRELATYVKLTGMKPLPSVAPKREALYQLGLRLFYDKQLSGKNNISCGSCHSLAGYSADTLPLGVGEGSDGLGPKRMQLDGAILARHTPAIYNLGLPGVNALFWDGRVQKHFAGGWLTPEPGLNGPAPVLKDIAHTLEDLLAVQTIFPIANPVEMLGKESTLSHTEAWDAALERIFTGRLGGSYKRFFREAFPGVEEYNIGHVGNALSELVRHHFLANNTPWDQYLKGNAKYMTERMKRGALVFMSPKAACTNCHTGEHLTSFGFQNIGVPQIGPGVVDEDDKGRMEFTGNPDDKYRFRVPPIRNAALTAPYMHTGTMNTMWEVIEHYAHPMRSLHHFQWDSNHPRYNEELKADQRMTTMRERTRSLATNLPRNIVFSVEEKKDLYCFLMVALTDLKLQADLISKGVLDEIDDCSPRLFN